MKEVYSANPIPERHGKSVERYKTGVELEPLLCYGTMISACSCRSWTMIWSRTATLGPSMIVHSGHICPPVLEVRAVSYRSSHVISGTLFAPATMCRQLSVFWAMLGHLKRVPSPGRVAIGSGDRDRDCRIGRYGGASSTRDVVEVILACSVRAEAYNGLRIATAGERTHIDDFLLDAPASIQACAIVALQHQPVL